MPLTADNFANALIASTVAGFGATTLGAVPALFLRRLDEKLNNNLLSFAAGVMLAATIFSLLLPAIAKSRAGEQHERRAAGDGGVAFGRLGALGDQQTRPA